MDFSVTAPLWGLSLVCLLAAVWFAFEAQRANAGRAAAQSEAAAAKAEATLLQSAIVERDVALKEVKELSIRLAAAESSGEARSIAAHEREQALIDLRAAVETSFGALAGDALAKSEQRFLSLANETFQKHQSAAAGGVKEVMTPVQEAFTRLAESLTALDKSRLQDTSALGQQMREIGVALKETQGLTGKLVNALRAAPKTRGRWGEETLRNVLELAGMTAHVDFHEQATVDNDQGAKLRPDVTIRLPGNRVIVVDSKVALSGYLDAMDAVDEAGREACLKKHAQQLREHVRQLASKDYWKYVPDTADFVALFVPGENFFAAAAERDPELFEFAIRNRVIIVTPATLMALAKAVSYGWRQEDSARNAQEIAALGRELYRRLAGMADKLTGLGNSLEKSVKSYNELVGTVEARVLPQARRFKELGAGEEDEIARIETSDIAPRLPTPQGELLLGELPASPPRASKRN
ncbi:MAG: DNA recombination protein RmuC [Caulobacterales bacterium]|jgi:DNA recombination protein RmuC